MAYLYLDYNKKKSHPGTLLFSSRGENGRCKDITFFYFVKSFLRNIFFMIIKIDIINSYLYTPL